MSWVDWSDNYAPICPACRAIYAARTPPEESPCGTCKPILLEINEDVARVFMATRRQVVTIGTGQPVDLNIPAVKIVMDLYGVQDQRTCLSRVMRVWDHFEQERREDAG